jgi:hypothetical protein
MKHLTTKHQFVEFIPEPKDLEEGTLYISETYGAAIHKCYCGCGHQVSTPLSQFWGDNKGWDLAKHEDGTITLSPSIGNFQMPCKTHYNITKSQIIWHPN